MKKTSLKLVISLFVIALFGFQTSTIIAQDNETVMQSACRNTMVAMVQ